MTEEFQSTLNFDTSESQAAMWRYVFERMMSKVCTATIVQVKAVSNAGEVAQVGTVTVKPMIHLIGSDGNAIEHGELTDVPYFRAQGGTDAIILDPKVNDIGLAVFAMRDISTVVKNRAEALPNSYRMFDWTDGLYIGGFLNGVPQQYIQFTTGGIKVVSPTKITLQAPTVQIDASSNVAINTPTTAMSQSATVGTTLTATTDVVGGGKSLKTHVHSGVTSGGSNTGAPV